MLLTTTPILRIADPNKYFIVCTDACNDVLGGFLNQEGYIIAYGSKKLNIHEKNYVTYELELAIVIHALKMWQDRWLAFLSKYDFEIQHIRGN